MKTCPALCSFNGQCTDSGCVCDAGWTGDDCSQVKESCDDGPHVLGYSPASETTLDKNSVIGVRVTCLDEWEVFVCEFNSTSRNGSTVLYRFPATVVYSIGVECAVPIDLLEKVYGNSSSSDASECGIHDTKTVDFTLLRVVTNFTSVESVITADEAASNNLTGVTMSIAASYSLTQCVEDGDCVHGGVCWKGVCRCAFGWCGAFCASPADNVCDLPTHVSESAYVCCFRSFAVMCLFVLCVYFAECRCYACIK